MNATTNKIFKTYDNDGNEVIILADEQGIEITKTVSNNIYETRQEVVPIEAVNILNNKEIKALKKVSKKKTRLVNNNLFLFNKETGETYVIKIGFLPKIEERIAKNMSGTFLTIHPEGKDMELLNIIVPFKIDGTIPDQFPFIIEEKNV